MSKRRNSKYAINLSCSAVALITGMPALAQTIDGEVITPVATSTIDAGAPGDIIVTDTGVITISSGTDISAITIDSDNAVSNSGAITVEAIDGGVGALLEGGRAGDFFSDGAITLSDGYEREDADDDGDLDGSYAVGTSRTGILLDDAGAFAGDITLGNGSIILVEGNDSAGVTLSSPLVGSFSNDGTISVVGDNAVGIDVQSGIDGDFLQSGAVTALGENARGVSFIGDLNGGFTNEGSVLSTGFASTAVTNYADPDDLGEDDTPIADRIDAEDLLDNEGALTIGGSLADGFLNNGIVDTFLDEDELADETKDTVEDFDENRSTGIITSYGSGPALIISPDLDPTRTSDIVIGEVVETIRDTLDDDEDEDFTETLATFSYDYGLINRGTIIADGLNVGFEAVGARIEGAADGSLDTIIAGGIQNSGSIQARAFEADATALSLGRGAVVGVLNNEGVISASVTSEIETFGTGILVEDGADLATISNSGTISATAVGQQSVSYAIRDLSGSVQTVENQGFINAISSLDSEEDIGLAGAVAIDLSGHSSSQAAVVRQTRQTPTDDLNADGDIDEDDVATPRIAGDVLFGAGDDLFDIQAGEVASEVYLGDGDDIAIFSNAEFEGAIFGGAGVDQLTFANGLYAGEIDLGDGLDSLTITDAAFVGSIQDSDGALDISISNSSFELVNDMPVAVQNLFVENGSILSISTDVKSENFSDARLTVTDLAQISADTTINAAIENFAFEPVELTLIEASSLVFDGGDISDVIINAPAIYSEQIGVDETSLTISLAPKTPDELGLNTNEASAYASLLTIAGEIDEIGSALTSIEDEGALLSAYRDLLPDYTDVTTRFLSDETSLSKGSMATRFDQIRAGRNGFWLLGAATYSQEKESTETTGYSGYGVSFQSGYDRKLGEHFHLGGAGAIRIGKFTPENNVNGEIETTSLDLSIYSVLTFGDLQIDLNGVIGKANFYSDRITNLSDRREIYAGEWGGTYYGAGARVSYEAGLGNYYIRPTMSVDYFDLSQDGYTDGAAGDDVLAMTVGSVGTSRSSGAALLNFGRRTGQKQSENFRPSRGLFQSPSSRNFFQNLYAGYRVELDATPYEAVAQFAAGGDSFTIFDPTENENSFLAGGAVGAVGDGYTLSFGYDGEFSGDFMSHRLGATFKLSF